MIFPLKFWRSSLDNIMQQSSPFAYVLLLFIQVIDVAPVMNGLMQDEEGVSIKASIVIVEEVLPLGNSQIDLCIEVLIKVSRCFIPDLIIKLRFLILCCPTRSYRVSISLQIKYLMEVYESMHCLWKIFVKVIANL
jgi:hypothetical protein